MSTLQLKSWKLDEYDVFGKHYKEINQYIVQNSS